MGKCRFVVFADIHYLNQRPKVIDASLSRKLTQFAIPITNTLIDDINKYKPNFCVCLGDLIEDTLSHEQDITNFTYIWNKLKRLEVPFYSVLGNHDLRTMNSRSELEKIMEIKNATFSFDFNGYHFVVLTTNIREDIGNENAGIYRTQYMSEPEINWLRKDLANNKLPCIIFTHFGLAEDTLIGNYWFESDPQDGLMGNRGVIKDIITQNNHVIAVFSAHQHWTKQLQENGINYYVVGSLTDNIDMQGIPDGIYLKVELEDNTIKIEEDHAKINIGW